MGTNLAYSLIMGKTSHAHFLIHNFRVQKLCCKGVRLEFYLINDFKNLSILIKISKRSIYDLSKKKYEKKKKKKGGGETYAEMARVEFMGVDTYYNSAVAEKC